MRERPIQDLADALHSLGVSVDCPTGCPPLTIHAAGLAGGSAAIRADASSQFLSGLLLASPCAQSETRLRLEGEFLSAPLCCADGRDGSSVRRNRPRLRRRPRVCSSRQAVPVGAKGSLRRRAGCVVSELLLGDRGDYGRIEVTVEGIGTELPPGRCEVRRCACSNGMRRGKVAEFHYSIRSAERPHAA